MISSRGRTLISSAQHISTIALHSEHHPPQYRYAARRLLLQLGIVNRSSMATSPHFDGANSSVFSAETYFATQPPPPSLEQDVARVHEFLQKQLQDGRKVVLVTVRFLPHLTSLIVADLRVAERRNHRSPRAQCVSIASLLIRFARMCSTEELTTGRGTS